MLDDIRLHRYYYLDMSPLAFKGKVSVDIPNSRCDSPLQAACSRLPVASTEHNAEFDRVVKYVVEVSGIRVLRLARCSIWRNVLDVARYGGARRILEASTTPWPSCLCFCLTVNQSISTATARIKERFARCEEAEPTTSPLPRRWCLTRR